MTRPSLLHEARVGLRAAAGHAGHPDRDRRDRGRHVPGGGCSTSPSCCSRRDDARRRRLRLRHSWSPLYGVGFVVGSLRGAEGGHARRAAAPLPAGPVPWSASDSSRCGAAPGLAIAVLAFGARRLRQRAAARLRAPADPARRARPPAGQHLRRAATALTSWAFAAARSWPGPLLSGDRGAATLIDRRRGRSRSAGLAGVAGSLLARASGGRASQRRRPASRRRARPRWRRRAARAPERGSRARRGRRRWCGLGRRLLDHAHHRRHDLRVELRAGVRRPAPRPPARGASAAR